MKKWRFHFSEKTMQNLFLLDYNNSYLFLDAEASLHLTSSLNLSDPLLRLSKVQHSSTISNV